MDTRYTKKDVQAWKESLITLPKRIRAKEDEIADKTQRYNELEPRLRDLKDNKIPAKELFIKKLHAKMELPTLPGRIREFSDQAKTLRAQSNALDAPIRQIEDEMRPVQAEIGNLEKLITIKHINSDITHAENLIESCRNSYSRDDHELVNVRHTLTSQINNLNDNKHALEALKASKDDLVRRLEVLRQTTSSMATDGFSSSVSDMSGYTSNVTSVAYSPEVSSLELQLVDFEARIASCRERVRQSQLLVDHSQSRVIELERQIDDYRRDIRKAEMKKDASLRQLNAYGAFELADARTRSSEHLSQNLHAYKDKLRSLEVRLNELQREKSSLEKNHDVALKNEHSLVQTKMDYERLIKDFSEKGDINAEKKQLQDLRKEKKSIEDLDSEIQADIKELKDIRHELISANGNVFLQSLDNSPQQLLDALLIKLQRETDQFEIDNPRGQSAESRKCLAELKHKTTSLLALVMGDKSDDNELVRKKYYALCGFIRYWEQKLHDFNLERVLATVLRDQSIDLSEARDDFYTLRNLNTNDLNDINDVDLLTYEAKVYTTAHAHLKTFVDKVNAAALPELRDVKNAGLALLVEMKTKEDKTKNDDKKPFDYKYYTSVLNMAGRLLAEPNNRGLHKSFRDLVSHTIQEDKASIGYKIGGIALMLLGAVVAAAGAVVAFLGFPIGAPLYCTVPAMVAGAALIATGIGLFSHGFNKGLAGKLNQFDRAVDQHQDKLLAHESTSLKGPGSYQ